MDSPEQAGKWLDFHVLLNALAVLSSRVRDQHPASSELLDSINGYLTSSLEMQRNGSLDSIEQFRDWLHCVTDLRNTTQRTRVRSEVHCTEEDAGTTLRLDGLRELVAQAWQSLQAVGPRTDPHLLRVQVLPTGLLVQVLRDIADDPEPIWHRELAGDPFRTP